MPLTKYYNTASHVHCKLSICILKDGKTPLELAMQQSNREIVQYFIKEAKINISLLAEVHNSIFDIYILV